MKRKIIGLLCTAMIMAGFTLNTFAKESRFNLDDTESITILDADQTPIFEGGVLSRAAKVTESWVLYYAISNGNFVEVEGYVTMKDGSKDAYHYTRVEMQSKTNGSIYKKSDNTYGTGKVWARTGLLYWPANAENYKGVIYYGTN